MTTFIFWFTPIVYTLILTYLVVGFIIAFEVSAAMNGGKYAVRWLKKHFSYEELYWSVIIFYPIIEQAIKR